MKYRLPRIVFDPDTYRISKREVRRQNIEIIKMNQRHLKEFASICKAVVKTGLPDYLVCKKLSKMLGSGIFLHPKAKPIKKGQIIGPYAGIMSLLAQNLPGDSCYVFSLATDMHLTKSEQKKFDKKSVYRPNRFYAIDIDAEKVGNFIRFVNHSSDKPNVEAEFFSVPKNSYGLALSPIEVVYIAKKTIYPGEQLLISYEEGDNSYWTNLEIDPFPMGPKTFYLGDDLKLIGPTKN